MFGGGERGGVLIEVCGGEGHELRGGGERRGKGKGDEGRRGGGQLKRRL